MSRHLLSRLSPSWCAQAVQHGKRRPPRHGRATKHWTKPRDLFEGRGWKTRPPHQKTAAMAMNIAQTAQHRRVGHRCTHPPDGTLLQHKPCRYIHPQPTTHHHLGSHLCLVAAGCPEGVHIKLPKVSLCHFPAVCLWTSRRTILKFISLANPSDIFAFFFIKLSASVAKGPGSGLARAISSPSPCRFLLVTSPREERGGGGCVCPPQPYGYRSLTPAPLELPSPSGGFPPKGQARPMNSRQDMSLAVTRGTPRPTPSRRRPRCTATFWACLRMVSHAASVAGKLLGHCPAPCMRHFSYRPWPSRSGSQRGHAGTWRNFGGRLQWRP